MPTNTLYIMTGLPYSGKSTLARELAKRFGFVIVSVDKIMDRENMWRAGHPTQSDWNQAYSEAYKSIEKQLKQGKNIVFDCGNLPRHERETPRSIAQNLGVESKLIYLKIDTTELSKRRQENELTKKRGHLDDEEMEMARKLWEEPKPEENPIIFSQKSDLDEWIKDNIEV